MAALIRAAYFSYKQIIKEYAVSFADEYFLMKTPWPTIAIAAFYMYFVWSLGPRLMKNRPAFKIDSIIQVYNLIQIGLCLYIIKNCHVDDDPEGFPWFDHFVDYEDNHYSREAIFVNHLYFMMKLIDLLDTVFFVLRKKYNQITFLHVYHHAIMFVMGWFFTKFLPGGHAAFLGYINCYVHVVMYAYYFITSKWPKYKKNIWWKKYITQMQMVQFFLITIHSFCQLLKREARYPKLASSFIFIQNIIMFILFYNFYRNAYLKKKQS